jgi:2',3'-cyclic-nucleotide 2'-phosphodiesterase (5'-nucleotidase family)
MQASLRSRAVPLSAALVIFAIFATPVLADPPGRPDRDGIVLWLTILHNNDAESKLIGAGGSQSLYGGAARFVTLMNQLKADATARQRGDRYRPWPRREVLVLSAGDNFLAGPEFNASLRKGPPFYDATVIDLAGYDALGIGNHEFDFGPDVFADFIESNSVAVPYVSSNLDFDDEPRLAGLQAQRRLARSVIIEKRGMRIGVVGATTPLLPFISSPRNAFAIDVVGAINAEVAKLKRRKVNKIVLVSHLQGIDEERALVPQLRDVDVVLAGGGSEVLSNPGFPLVPGDGPLEDATYPLMVEDASGRKVPVVTAEGNYKYIGRLVVGFDARGEIVRIDTAKSGPVRVSGNPADADAVEPDPTTEALVTRPVQAAVAALAANVLAVSEVPLEGRRSNVRRVETNVGNLATDALLWQARQLADAQGLPQPQVAVQNGGGIRNDSIIAAGNVSELNTFQILPFSNFVTVLPSVPRAEVKAVLENACSRVEFSDGRFAQVAGLRFTYDRAGTPGVGPAAATGSRVRDVVLDDGTVIVQDGAVIPGPGVTIATIDFLARGGDQYPFAAPFVNLAVSYQQALANYLVNGLSGQVTAAAYSPAGQGRISCVTSDAAQACP